MSLQVLRGLALALILSFAPSQVLGAPNDMSLADLSLEDMLNQEVTSVSKKAQRLVEAPAAVFAIRAEDIRRSGATNIPDLLRMVPGLDVKQATSSNWAVSARGFNGQFSNKLLVMVDGRSVYTPLFSGVYWDIQNVPLHDIARIEVIRGPGATVWGANAVNGVINIITKEARDTQGNMVSALAGNHDRLITNFRVGGEASPTLQYRVSGQVFNRDELESTTGLDFGDKWRQGRLDLRLDWQANERDSFRFSGHSYRGDSRGVWRMDLAPPFSGLPEAFDPVNGFLTPNLESDVRGGDLIVSWAREISEDQSTELQLYYDNRVRNSRALSENRRTFDMDFQHQLRLSESNELIWGAGWRLNDVRLDDSLNIDFAHDNSREALYSGFLQDEIVLSPELLTFTAGSKVEFNTYTGWEIQPSARLLYTPVDNQQLWTAVSRSVRSPAQAERELTALTVGVFPAGFNPICDLAGPPCAVQIVGNEDFESETLIAYEFGYRIQPTPKLALDFATFFNDYQNLVSVLPASLATPFTLVYSNRGEARSYGFEAAAQWQAKDWWKLASSFTTLRVADDGTLGDEPGYQFSLRSMVDLPGNVELDTSFFFTGDYSTANLTGTTVEVGKHWRTDVRLAWRARPGLELSLVGQNLFDPDEPEWVGLLNPNGVAELQRTFYGKVNWEF